MMGILSAYLLRSSPRTISLTGVSDTATTGTAQYRWKRYSGCSDSAEILAHMWPSYDALTMAEVLKPGCVFSVGDIVIKVGSARRLTRSAEAWQRLAPTPSPEPLMLGTSGNRGILLMRRCPGVHIGRVWHEEPVREAFALLVADLMKRRIIHGDLAPQNLLWDGSRLWLIDLDGLRPFLHGLFWRHHWVRTWAWVQRRMPHRETVRPTHDRCGAELGLTGLDRRWQAVMAYEERIRKRSPVNARSRQSAGIAQELGTDRQTFSTG